jgi:serine/threonine-protein kinase HipA
MSAALSVYFETRLVGRLLQKGEGGLLFEYDASWLSSPEALPLSIRLPLRPGPFEGELCRTFFSNLLPEGATRALIARKLGVSESNDFGLLEALGGECAGALRTARAEGGGL